MVDKTGEPLFTGTERLNDGSTQVRIPRRFILGALLGLCVAKVHADILLLGTDYQAKANDTYVKADAGTCCVGEYPGMTNVYIGQSFIATGRIPHSLTLGLANGFGTPAENTFRLLITELSPGGFQPGKVLWEGGPYSLEVNGYSEYTYEIRGVVLSPGVRYAWILDTFSTRDGVPNALNFYWNGGTGNYGAPIYSDGQAWMQNAFGDGRAADFGYPWWYAGGASMSFLMRYRGNAPTP